MTIKVLMLPTPKPNKPGTSGIARVVEAYTKYLPSFGIDLVHPDSAGYDLLALHVSDNFDLVDERPMVLHNHGLHWTADYQCRTWQHAVNRDVIDAIRHATAVTVPSAWVAESFQRDMRFTPHVIPHGIDWQDWQSDDTPRGDYVLWNKNRNHDICDPTPVLQLAHAHPKAHFVTTFIPDDTPTPTNTNVIGVIPYDQMKRLVQSALVYLSTTKETFGIGALEAMASGVPVLGYAHGGNVGLIQHGTNGYLAQPGDVEDLAEGLAYCLAHRDTLGANARELAKEWTWKHACEMVAQVYQDVVTPQPATVGIVIPTYNKTEDELGRAIKSARNSTYIQLTRIVIVDDGSQDGEEVERIVGVHGGSDNRVELLRQDNAGVAVARNKGIEHAGDTKYICCLDADDAIEERFIEVCVNALEADRSLGIAYTGLRYILPDGKEGISEWPGEWDFDAQLKAKGQVPTCNVARREVWDRLGGQRSRYCPSGAGEEDAEMWLRAGAYGWKAKKVTDEGLFIYSWQSGQVSGNRQHAVTDYRGWHPWVNDHQHSFASYATPRNGLSHPVRYYDEPSVSVIIPVGPGHEQTVINALDSLEAQTFKKWEVIVVWDAGGQHGVAENDHTLRLEMPEASNALLRQYPYVKLRYTGKGEEGPGHSRNFGVEIARAPFLLFLDADDWLYPECLERMVASWNEHQQIIYTDYVGKAIVTLDDLADDLKERVYTYNEHTGEAVIGYRAFDYDCELAQSQPHGERPYIWANVTALIPRAWHNAIDGFDESLSSWEDVDYHWRLAKAGYCYHRIEKELLVYNFHYGHRRERGRQTYQNLLDYLREKHERIEAMPCSGCGRGRTRVQRQTTVSGSQQARSAADAIDDADFVMARYLSPNRGKHQVTGHALFGQPIPGWRMIRRSPESWSIDYGYRGGGAKFLVHRDDVESQPGLFVPVETQRVLNVPEEAKVIEPPKALSEELGEVRVVEDVQPNAAGVVDSILSAPTDQPRAFDLQTLPGVNSAIARLLIADGIDSKEKLLELGVGGLQDYRGVGKVKAQRIIDAIGGME